MSDGERAIDKLLAAMVERKASDLHLMAGSPPIYRVHGKLIPVDHPPLTSETTQEMITGLLTPAQQRRIDQYFTAELTRLGSDFPYPEFCDLSP